jgi:hypothetical protein
MSSRFMEIVKTVGEAINQAAPGLSNALPEIGAELKRLGVQGQMEAASALFNGHAFVPYGPGQRGTEAEKAIEPPDWPLRDAQEHSHGREM